MCRMIAAPSGILGEGIIEPFVRMARGKNALHKHNMALGEFQHPAGWASCTRREDRSKSYRSVRSCWNRTAQGAHDHPHARAPRFAWASKPGKRPSVYTRTQRQILVLLSQRDNRRSSNRRLRWRDRLGALFPVSSSSPGYERSAGEHQGNGEHPARYSSLNAFLTDCDTCT